MSASNFIPELWAQLLLTNFRKNLVFQSLTNRDYEGEIRNQGDTVRINTPSAVAVRSYAGSVSYDSIASTQQSLLIDQAKYFAFDVPDIDAAQANVSLTSPYITEAAQALADTVDQSIANLYVDAAHGVTGSIIATATDPYTDLVEAGQKLDEHNVPRGGRWVVVTPKVYAWLLKNNGFIAGAAGETSRNVVTTAQVGMVAGFTVYVSNNVVRTGAGKVSQNVYGTNAAITFGEQINSVETLRREASFADGVRGLLVYGHKVVRPAALGAWTVTESA